MQYTLYVIHNIPGEFQRQIEESGISEEVLLHTPIKDLNQMMKVRKCILCSVLLKVNIKMRGLKKDVILALKYIRRTRVMIIHYRILTNILFLSTFNV